MNHVVERHPLDPKYTLELAWELKSEGGLCGEGSERAVPLQSQFDIPGAKARSTAKYLGTYGQLERGIDVALNTNCA